MTTEIIKQSEHGHNFKNPEFADQIVQIDNGYTYYGWPTML